MKDDSTPPTPSNDYTLTPNGEAFITGARWALEEAKRAAETVAFQYQTGDGYGDFDETPADGAERVAEEIARISPGGLWIRFVRASIEAGCSTTAGKSENAPDAASLAKLGSFGGLKPGTYSGEGATIDIDYGDPETAGAAQGPAGEVEP